MPAYLVLDCSGSMAGAAIQAVAHGVTALAADLAADPLALETAFLSVITFDNSAKQVVPLTELSQFSPPALTAGGGTSLGAALRLLEKAIAEEVRPSSATQKGDWTPMVYLMTDGRPTDDWQEAADRLKAKLPTGRVVACAAGASADSTVLKQITDTVVKLETVEPGVLGRYFRWVSRSIQATSQRAQAGGLAAALPPLPNGVTIVP